jgi:hypothetical protein
METYNIQEMFDDKTTTRSTKFIKVSDIKEFQRINEEIGIIVSVNDLLIELSQSLLSAQKQKRIDKLSNPDKIDVKPNPRSSIHSGNGTLKCPFCYRLIFKGETIIDTDRWGICHSGCVPTAKY